MITKTERIVAKVQALLNQADHPNTGKAEAATFRTKAEELMQQYRIEESEAIASGEATSLKPVSKVMRVCRTGSPYRDEYFTLAHYVAHHTGVRYVGVNERDDQGDWWTAMTLVGYESDVQFSEMLYTSIRLAFAANLEPKYNATESDMLNVYRMRNAGMTRDEIAWAMGWLVINPDTGKRLMTASAAADKASRLYGQACRELGAEPKLLGKGTSMKIYKELYAESFTAELYYRLRNARDGVDSQAGALVLANRKETVNDAFYDLFPYMRPAAPATTPAERETAPVKEETPAQRARREAKQERAMQKQWERDNSMAGRIGRQAGAKAARSVELNGPAPTKRLG